MFFIKEASPFELLYWKPRERLTFQEHGTEIFVLYFTSKRSKFPTQATC